MRHVNSPLFVGQSKLVFHRKAHGSCQRVRSMLELVLDLLENTVILKQINAFLATVFLLAGLFVPSLRTLQNLGR